VVDVDFSDGLDAAEEKEVLGRLETLNAIGVALSSERDVLTLMERILDAARDFADADGGTLYLVKDDALHFEVIRNDSLGYKMGGRNGPKIEFAPLPLRLADGTGNHGMVVAHAALTGRTINIADAYEADGYDFSGTRAFDARTGYRSESFLTVPMKDHSGAVIGVLQLINAKDSRGFVRPFSSFDQQLVESLASQAAIVLNNRQLLEQLETLFESLINLINTAIDEKSPYTGGHCDRVPVLTMMLAEAASRVTQGPLADFNMSEKDRYELKIAGLLHDCGKITTPVHVVD
jgi:GAF domain-containing protein